MRSTPGIAERIDPPSNDPIGVLLDHRNDANLASGIGFATAVKLASEGVTIAILDVNEEGLDPHFCTRLTSFRRAKKAAQELSSKSKNAAHFGLSCDVTSFGSLKKAFATVLERLKRIDIVFNNVRPRERRDLTMTLGWHQRNPVCHLERQRSRSDCQGVEASRGRQPLGCGVWNATGHPAHEGQWRTHHQQCLHGFLDPMLHLLTFSQEG